MKPNIIKEKSFDFAIDIVNLYKELAYNKKENVMSRQLLKSGTFMVPMLGRLNLPKVNQIL